MKSSFLSHEQLFVNPPHFITVTGAAAAVNDLCLLTAPDDGFVHDGSSINYYLADGKCADRFGRDALCRVCAVRPAIALEQGDEKKLRSRRQSGDIITVEFGSYPSAVLESSLRELAVKQYDAGVLEKTEAFFTLGGVKHPVYRLSGRQLVRIEYAASSPTGFVTLSDGTAVCEGEAVFLEVKPVRWFLESERALLVCCGALFAGLDRQDASEYLETGFIPELTADMSAAGGDLSGFRIEDRDELSIIRAFVEADVPVFIHGLSGDGKSDRVKEIDPQVLDIELVNETPETINGRAIYNEASNEIIDVKPAWLVRLEKLCADGKPHVLFFDELTNATKQTQAVIFKIVLERFVNNRWPLPENARIVAAGNDRSESTAAHDLAEPLFGRFAHVFIQTDVENWMPWAVKKNINPFVLEFLANNALNLRTPYTGKQANADPRRWEMASRVLDSSGNDLSLLDPVVGPETAEAFRRFFIARRETDAILSYSDEELSRFSTARKYQLAQQCLCVPSPRLEEARELVRRLGAEYLAWFDYVLARKQYG